MRPYSGPYKVINRASDRVYEIDVNGTARQVSVKNIKPAYFLRDDLSYTHLTPNTSDTATNTGLKNCDRPSAFNKNLYEEKESIVPYVLMYLNHVRTIALVNPPNFHTRIYLILSQRIIFNYFYKRTTI